MRKVLLAALLLCLGVPAGFAIPITLFMDSDTFIQRAKDIVVAECVSVQKQEVVEDGLQPVNVKIVKVLKGDKKAGDFKIATIYRMKPSY